MAEMENSTMLSRLPDSVVGIFPGGGSRTAIARRDKDPRNSGNPALRFLAAIALLAVVLVLAAVIFLFMLTSGDLPENLSPPEPVTFGDNVKLSLPDKLSFTVSSGNVNHLLEIGRANINNTLSRASYPGIKNITIADMYADIGNQSGMLYSHLNAEILGVSLTIPVQMKFRVGLENNCAVIYIDYTKAGSVSIPFSVIKTAIDNGNLPREFSAKNNKVLYDLSRVNDIIHEMIIETRPDIVNEFNNSINQAIENNVVLGTVASILDFIGIDVSQLVDNAVSTLIDNVFEKVDINVSVLTIQDGQLWVEGVFAKKES